MEIKWVKGHAGIVGNEGADQLANLGCTYDEEEDWDWEAKTEQFNAVFQEELEKKNQLEAKGKKRAKVCNLSSHATLLPDSISRLHHLILVMTTICLQ